MQESEGKGCTSEGLKKQIAGALVASLLIGSAPGWAARPGRDGKARGWSGSAKPAVP